MLGTIPGCDLEKIKYCLSNNLKSAKTYQKYEFS